jgi:hypothetical protein
MHYRHNLDRELDNLHLRSELVMLRVPRALLGVSARKAWAVRVLHETPPMPERSPAESPFQKYCLDRWREVAIEHLAWNYQDTNVHDFTREALMGSNFPWDGSFEKIYEHLVEGQAQSGARDAFVQSWQNAGLHAMGFCLDCKAWVDGAEVFRCECEETLESEDEQEQISIEVHGCWVVRADDYVRFECSHLLTDYCDPWGKLLREYGADTALFEKRVGAVRSAEAASLGLPSKKQRSRLCWEYNSDYRYWRLRDSDWLQATRWRKTCRAKTVVREAGHFPRRAERCDVKNPSDIAYAQ